MRAMVLTQPGQPLQLQDWPVPVCGPEQVLIEISACGLCRTDLHVVDGELTDPVLPHAGRYGSACGLCRTDLHVVDGELTDPVLPLIPGHQIVGRVRAVGDRVKAFQIDQRIGVPWLGGTCRHCDYCNSGRENLCDTARYTGYQIPGGFAEFTAADARYCFPIPDGYGDVDAAPLLCAGLIGYRAYRPLLDAKVIGLYGFGAAAHILIQVARHRGQTVYAFTRAGDGEAQHFARHLGAAWAGDAAQAPPQAMDGAIIFAPAGELVPLALKQLRKGGQLICAGIHMSDIPGFPYADLWGERSIRSVANLTRADGEEFLPLAASIPVRTEVHRYPLEQANRALDDLRAGRFTGAAVLIP